MYYADIYDQLHEQYQIRFNKQVLTYALLDPTPSLRYVPCFLLRHASLPPAHFYFFCLLFVREPLLLLTTVAGL